jgi:hypothetical protein
MLIKMMPPAVSFYGKKNQRCCKIYFLTQASNHKNSLSKKSLERFFIYFERTLTIKLLKDV